MYNKHTYNKVIYNYGVPYCHMRKALVYIGIKVSASFTYFVDILVRGKPKHKYDVIGEARHKYTVTGKATRKYDVTGEVK